MNEKTKVVFHHDDHTMTDAQRNYGTAKLLSELSPTRTFAAITFTLPAELGTLPNALYGPDSGDEPVKEDQVQYAFRVNRPWKDRLVDLPLRDSRLMTVIGAVVAEDTVKVFTMHGGPLASHNPEDPSCPDVAAAKLWWSQHALSSRGM